MLNAGFLKADDVLWKSHLVDPDEVVLSGFGLLATDLTLVLGMYAPLPCACWSAPLSLALCVVVVLVVGLHLYVAPGKYCTTANNKL